MNTFVPVYKGSSLIYWRIEFDLPKAKWIFITGDNIKFTNWVYKGIHGLMFKVPKKNL